MSYEQFAYYYDRLMREMPYKQWLQFVNTCWDRYGKPYTLVDLGCGTGSLAIPFAQSGMKVFAVDRSSDMLAVARSKSDCGGGSILWLCQDIRQWQLPERVDAVVSFCDCLNYLLEESDIVQAFRQTMDGLIPGGLFVFDVHAPRQLASYMESQPFLLDEEDIAYIWTCSFDAEICEIEHDLTLFVREDQSPESFRRIHETHVQRAYPLDWLKHQLFEVGFATVDCYADFSWEPVNEETERAFFVCQKAK